MSEFRDRSPGFARVRTAIIGTVGIALLVTAALVIGSDRNLPISAVFFGLPVLGLIFGVLIPWLRWGRSDLVVDDAGIRFGARGRHLPTRYWWPGDATAYPLFVPWSAVRQAAIVGPEATPELLARARVGVGRFGQVSRFWGFFPSSGARHHLVMTVDASAIEYPPDSTGLRMGTVNLVPSTAWALPVRDAEGLRRRLGNTPG